MATLFTALQALAPVEYASLPVEDLSPYLEQHYTQARILIDSVPIPASDGSPDAGRSRANTAASVASNLSEVSASSARSRPLWPEHVALQKEWGKPIKLSAKDNPLGIAVYKLGAKDGRGAWFARRSVHEGVQFAKWRRALEDEFATSLEVQGAPGEGNVRGIGAERRVVRKDVDGLGRLEVYHLSAQFPGPTAPRDFVTLLMTSSVALAPSASSSEPATGSGATTAADGEPRGSVPRHFLVISKPCEHPECPPREGFVRGQYESVEFIREIALDPEGASRGRTAVQSSTKGRHRANTASLDGKLPLPNDLGLDPRASHSVDQGSPEAARRARGKTISFVQSDPRPTAAANGLDSGADAALHPVEWIMITRSDPGGNVPRWMVERGTPSSIVADAAKFLDWACKLKDSPKDDGERRRSDAIGHAVAPEANLASSEEARVHDGHAADPATAAVGRTATTTHAVDDSGRDSDASSIDSFTTASSGARSSEPDTIDERATLNEASSLRTTSSWRAQTRGSSGASVQSGLEKPLAKLQERKRRLQEKLEARRTKLLAPTTSTTTTTTTSAAAAAAAAADLPAKDAAALAKAEERHKKDVEKHEERYRRHVQKMETKRDREARKREEKSRKQADKDEKARLAKEREELSKLLDLAKVEKQELMAQIGALQTQNTLLTAALGQLDPDALQHLSAPMQALDIVPGIARTPAAAVVNIHAHANANGGP
ncbi:MAG: hypothetical protein M1826_001158 [Phylliscum demangeonii]|nr:MAG: hypothetical protein M1826_001158 [Phylliscum demangeonii]